MANEPPDIENRLQRLEAITARPTKARNTRVISLARSKVGVF